MIPKSLFLSSGIRIKRRNYSFKSYLGTRIILIKIENFIKIPNIINQKVNDYLIS